MTVTLVKEKFVLDLGGKTPKEFIKAVEGDKGKRPAPVKLRILVEVKNKSKNDIR